MINSFLNKKCTQDTAGQKFKDLVCFATFASKESENKKSL